MRARDPQAEFEAVVGQLSGSTMPIISVGLETAVATTAREDAHRQRQGIDNLHRGRRLAAHDGEPLLKGRLRLPQVRGLPHEQAPVTQTRKPGWIMLPKIVEQVFVRVQFEVLATDFQGDDFFIGQLRLMPPCRSGCSLNKARYWSQTRQYTVMIKSSRSIGSLRVE